MDTNVVSADLQQLFGVNRTTLNDLATEGQHRRRRKHHVDAAFASRAKAWGLPLVHIDMKMAFVGFIGTRPKHGAEGFARLVVHKLQKFSFAVGPKQELLMAALGTRRT